MIFANYTELQAGVESYSARTDFADRFPFFVRLVEEKIGKEVFRNQEEAESQFTASASGAVVLPVDFRAARSVKLFNGAALFAQDPAAMQEAFPETGTPMGYWITGNTLQLYPKSAATITMIYQRGVSPLTVASPTSEFLSDFGTVYLWGCLANLYIWAQDMEKANAYRALFDEALVDASDQLDRRALMNTRISNSGAPTL